jgi:hypothetical protein
MSFTTFLEPSSSRGVRAPGAVSASFVPVFRGTTPRIYILTVAPGQVSESDHLGVCGRRGNAHQCGRGQGKTV